MTRQEALAYRAEIDAILARLTDEEAIDATILFRPWQSGKSYTDGTNDTPVSKVKYNDTLYKCILSHTSQDDWTPDVAVSLWVRVDDPAIEWPEWIQPVGSADAYEYGAKVSHNGKHWISNYEGANVWEPGVYGWGEVPRNGVQE